MGRQWWPRGPDRIPHPRERHATTPPRRIGEKNSPSSISFVVVVPRRYTVTPGRRAATRARKIIYYFPRAFIINI